jgi:hypothetical protein
MLYKQQSIAEMRQPYVPPTRLLFTKGACEMSVQIILPDSEDQFPLSKHRGEVPRIKAPRRKKRYSLIARLVLGILLTVAVTVFARVAFLSHMSYSHLPLREKLEQAYGRKISNETYREISACAREVSTAKHPLNEAGVINTLLHDCRVPPWDKMWRYSKEDQEKYDRIFFIRAYFLQHESAQEELEKDPSAYRVEKINEIAEENPGIQENVRLTATR